MYDIIVKWLDDETGNPFVARFYGKSLKETFLLLRLLDVGHGAIATIKLF